MNIIVRNSYLQKLDKMMKSQFVVLIVWLRRVGKSTLVRQYLDQHNYPEEEIIYLPLEQFDYLAIRSQDSLIRFLQDHHISKKSILVVDEIQLVQWRSEVINGLHAQYSDLKILLTGSNSSLLSSEISTHLRWRALQLQVYPFDIQEYCMLMQRSKNQQSMTQFLQQTWLPMAYSIQDRQQLVQEMISMIFLKDIVERYTIKDVELLRNLFAFMVSNTWNITNLSKIKNHLTQLWYTVNLNTLGNYVDYLIDSFLVYECKMYDIQWKKVFNSLRKFFVIDHGMRNYLFSKFDLGTWKQLENYVYIQLIKAWYAVYVWRMWDQEVDFVAEKNGKKMYLQVAWSLDSESVYDREFGNLWNIQDNRSKYVISMDDHEIGVYEWIQHVKAWELERVLWE